jgi:glutathione peroxidase
MSSSFYELSARRNDGAEQSMADYRGRVLLVVNVASKCGFTPQYAGLQALQDSYAARGFDVLGFPCDQFGHQEPGDDAAIRAFCDRSFGVTFPLFAKIEVNGPGTHPVFAWLKREKGGLLGSAIKWNFSKFLLGRDGSVLGRYPPTTTPDALRPTIEAALAESAAA